MGVVPDVLGCLRGVGASSSVAPGWLMLAVDLSQNIQTPPEAAPSAFGSVGVLSILGLWA